MKQGRSAGQVMPANKTVRYTFRLTEDQNIEFLKLLDATDCTQNKSEYIVSRLLN